MTVGPPTTYQGTLLGGYLVWRSFTTVGVESRNSLYKCMPTDLCEHSIEPGCMTFAFELVGSFQAIFTVKYSLSVELGIGPKIENRLTVLPKIRIENRQSFHRLVVASIPP